MRCNIFIRCSAHLAPPSMSSLSSSASALAARSPQRRSSRARRGSVVRACVQERIAGTDLWRAEQARRLASQL